MHRSQRVVAGAIIAAAGAIALAQPATRAATTRAMLLKDPLFFHARTVAIIDTPQIIDGMWRLPADQNKNIAVVFRTAPPAETAVEIRGMFVDIGRIAPDDSRVTAFGLRAIVDALGSRAPNAASAQPLAWPARDTLFAIVNASATPVELAGAGGSGQPTSIRAVALAPETFEGKPVTVRGRFRGHNILGDLPTWPKQTPNDFVLQSGDAALWVTGIKPKGKGFDLDPGARRDTGRWLVISGTATVIDGLPFVRARTIEQAAPDNDEINIGSDATPAAPPPPPPTISFSIPAANETDVAPTTLLRVQFSRDMNGESFNGRVVVSAAANGADVTIPKPTVTYRAGSNTVDVTFAGPLPRFATVAVSFRAGITAKDGTAFAPATLTFTTGG